MRIGGIQKFSLIDYPGKLCATVFTQGCNFRCAYCHNPELVEPSLYRSSIPEEKILTFLETRRGKLDAVTVTGGEPTIQRDLDRFLAQIKEAGFLIKLDTNGSQPDILKGLIKNRLVDYIAMDIKGPLVKYRQIVFTSLDTSLIKKSIRVISGSGINHEFRTTVVRSQLDLRDLLSIARLIRKAPLYALQTYVAMNSLNDGFSEDHSYSPDEMAAFLRRLEQELTCVVIR